MFSVPASYVLGPLQIKRDHLGVGLKMYETSGAFQAIKFAHLADFAALGDQMQRSFLGVGSHFPLYRTKILTL